MKAGSPIYVLKKKKQCFQLFPNRKRTLVLHDRFFLRRNGCTSQIACPKNRAL